MFLLGDVNVDELPENYPRFWSLQWKCKVIAYVYVGNDTSI